MGTWKEQSKHSESAREGGGSIPVAVPDVYSTKAESYFTFEFVLIKHYCTSCTYYTGLYAGRLQA